MSLAAFVDTNDLFHASVKRYHRRLDYAKLYDWIKEQHGEIYRAFAYGKYFKKNNSDPFRDALTHIGFTCQWASENHNWNVGISMDVVRVIDRVDRILIVSGDPELALCAQWVRERGVKCIICGVRIDELLGACADTCIELPRTLLLKGKPNVATKATEQLELSGDILRNRA